MVFERGQIFEGKYTNIFIKYVNNGMVKFIEGCSPSAIHNIQEIPSNNLEEYINNYGYKRASEEYEAFINA